MYYQIVALHPGFSGASNATVGLVAPNGGWLNYNLALPEETFSTVQEMYDWVRTRASIGLSATAETNPVFTTPYPDAVWSAQPGAGDDTIIGLFDDQPDEASWIAFMETVEASYAVAQAAQPFTYTTEPEVGRYRSEFTFRLYFTSDDDATSPSSGLTGASLSWLTPGFEWVGYAGDPYPLEPTYDTTEPPGYAVLVRQGPINRVVNQNMLRIQALLEELVDATQAADQYPQLALDLNGFRLTNLSDNSAGNAPARRA